MILNTLIQKTIKLNTLNDAQKNINIRYEETAANIKVLLDISKFQQVLNNLLGNAIKFSHKDSTIKVQLDTDNQNVIVRVKDNGVGISPTELERIFEPFFSGTNKPTSNEPSTGMGLSIVKGIISQLGGEISVESKLGMGSCFTITLPQIV